MKQIELRKRFKDSGERALLGNTNSSIRAIAVGSDGIKLIIVCYLNRVPTEEDFDSLNDISAEISADFDYNKLHETCEFSAKSIAELEEASDMVIIEPITKTY